MALTLYNKNGKYLGVRPDTPLQEKLTDEGGWTAGGARTPRTPDPAVPELSQIPIFFETDAIKEHLEGILEAYDAPAGGGGG